MNMVSTNTITTFAALVKNFVVSTLQDFYFLTQDPDEILTILINNEFDADLTWWEMYEGTGEDYLWNRWTCSNELRWAKQMMEFMVRKVGLIHLCTDDGTKIIRTRLSEIDFSNINYNFLSDDDSDGDSDIHDS
jgi:hypothetical protein